MDKLKILISLLVGILFVLIGFFATRTPKEIGRSELMHATISSVTTEAKNYRFYLTYEENGQQTMIQTVKYNSSVYKHKVGESVEFRFVEYTNGVKYAVLNDDELKPVSENSNVIGYLFLGLGGFLILVAAFLFIKTFFNS